MNVFYIKLITGEELLSKMKVNADTYDLSKPVRVALTQQGLAMGPYVPLLEEEEITIKKEHVMFYGAVAEEVYSAYNSKFGSGLTLPDEHALRIVGGK